MAGAGAPYRLKQLEKSQRSRATAEVVAGQQTGAHGARVRQSERRSGRSRGTEPRGTYRTDRSRARDTHGTSEPWDCPCANTVRHLEDILAHALC